MFLLSLFARRADAPPPAPPPLPEGSAAPVPGQITFDEVLRGLNPLHHLPVVGTIYREATGETIAPVMRILGGGVLGGPVGMLSSALMAALDEIRGKPASPPPGSTPDTMPETMIARTAPQPTRDGIG